MVHHEAIRLHFLPREKRKTYASLVTDMGLKYHQKSKLQSALDAAALAAVRYMPDEQTAKAVALEYVEKNGFTTDSVVVEFPSSEIVRVSDSRKGKTVFASLFKTDSVKINAKAAELILKDEYDFILTYNANYDDTLHKKGPEHPETIAQMGFNFRTFCMFDELIQTHWKHHNVLIGTGMDHGCHEIDGECGSHGLDMPEDLNIVHLYKGYPKN